MKLPDDVRAFLDAPRFAVLATIRADDSPHLTVVWYGVRGDELIVNTTVSRSKARNLERDPRVSLLVGEMARYVRIEGQARAVGTGADALRDIHDLGVRYDGQEAAERQTRAVWGKQDRVTFLIEIRRLYKYGFD
jgi:PPOX class probable F420-dependent enzyme